MVNSVTQLLGRFKPLVRMVRCITFPSRSHMLHQASGCSLADIRLIQDYLRHKDIQHTVRYTKLAPGRFTGLFLNAEDLKKIDVLLAQHKILD